MIDIKQPEQIEIMKKSGAILGEVLFAVMDAVKAGVSELEIDTMAEKMITERGGEPGFKRVPGYRHTVCACTNDVVVHGIPSAYRFLDGDMVCIDCGVYLHGYHTDMAETVIVGGATSKWAIANKAEYQKREHFLQVGKKALEAGISEAVIGNRVGHISKVIQEIVEKENGFSIVRSLIGHGVGKELHEDPEVPGFLDRKIERTPKLVEGMTIAVEVIYNMGGPDVVYAGTDDWSIKSADGSLSAVFERSIAITQNGPVVLTK